MKIEPASAAVAVAVALLGFWPGTTIAEQRSITGKARLTRRSVPQPTAPDELSVKGTIWVTNRTANNIAAFDAASGRVLGTVSVGATPIGITAPCGTGRVYVSNENSNQISVISKTSLTVLKTIPVGPRPQHIAHSSDGRAVYAAEFGTNKVAVINTLLDRLVAEHETGARTARTHAVWASPNEEPNEHTLYATNSVTNEIVALDAGRGTRLWSIPIGDNPSEILVTRDRRTAYVSVRNEDKIKIVDLNRRVVASEVVIGPQPDTLSLTRDGKQLWVGLRGRPAAAVLDIASGTVTAVDVPVTATGHNWLSTNGQFLFIAVEGDTPGVAVIDTQARRLITLYPYPGGGQPHGVFFEPSAWYDLALHGAAGCR